jgi:phage shock protein A
VQLQAENERMRGERDEFGRRFEDLSELRSTAVETTLEKYKANMETQGKGECA